MTEIVSLQSAIREHLHDGDTVAMEGFTHLIPFAAGHEVIRHGRKDLTLIRMTPDVIYDQLIGAGCAKKLIFSWGGNPGVGSLHRLRDAVEKVHTAKHHVELFRDKLVPQARQAFEANQFAYETGKASFLEWITAQRNLRDLEAMAQQHVADYYAALAELEAVVGTDLNIFPSIKGKEPK